MTIEAMKQALEALKLAVMQNEHDMLMTGEEVHKCVVAGIGLSQAIAEAEKQEPVAWLYESPMPDNSMFVGASVERLKIGIGVTPDTIETPLYTHPYVPTERQPKRERVVFPTMLRKMWSGGEVQAWLDENVNKEKNHVN